MSTVLYLSPGGRELWQRDKSGWRQIEASDRGHAWVVTDLSEESLQVATSPRLFGRDRSSFVERQLAARYPDSNYRGALVANRGTDIVEALAPTRNVLFGIDAAPRLDADLDALGVSVAGVWPMSMLLARLGQERSLPPSLFLVLPGPGTLRIVYVKDRNPVLTRLTLTPNEIKAQVDEIVRTVRHLENTQILPRGQQHPVLMLANIGSMDEVLSAAHLQPVKLPAYQKSFPLDWRFPLFDLALRSAPGQVAPISRRIGYLSNRLSKAARYLAVIIAFAGVAAAGGNVANILDLVGENRSIVESVQMQSLRLAEVESEISRYGIAPELVMTAIAVHQREIASVPTLASSLQLVAKAIGGDPALRLTEFQARLILPSASTCGVDLTSEDGMKRPEATSPGVDKRRMEIGFELAVPATYGPRDRAQTLRMVSGNLGNTDALTLWTDASRDIASGNLRGGTVVGVATRLGWCLTVPGAKPEVVDTNGAARS